MDNMRKQASILIEKYLFILSLGCFFLSAREELNARYLPVDFISNTAGHSWNQYQIRRNKISVWVIHQKQITIANVKPWHLVEIADANGKHPLGVNDASYADIIQNYLKLNLKWSEKKKINIKLDKAEAAGTNKLCCPDISPLLLKVPFYWHRRLCLLEI